MKPSLKKKWIEALRSGKYEQGVRYLEQRGKFCCLGVLRDVADPSDKRSAYNFNHMLTGSQLLEYGLEHSVQSELANLNDARVPFEVIAGLIDEAL